MIRHPISSHISNCLINVILFPFHVCMNCNLNKVHIMKFFVVCFDLHVQPPLVLHLNLSFSLFLMIYLLQKPSHVVLMCGQSGNYGFSEASSKPT